LVMALIGLGQGTSGVILNNMIHIID